MELKLKSLRDLRTPTDYLKEDLEKFIDVDTFLNQFPYWGLQLSGTLKRKELLIL